MNGAFKRVDRIFGWLLVLGSLMHGVGSFVAFENAPEMLLFSLSGMMAGLLLAALNLLRVERPTDQTLAWVCLAGCLGSLVLTAMFAASLGTIADYRVLTQAILQLALAGMSVRTMIGISVLRSRRG